MTTTQFSVEDRNRLLRTMRAAASDPHCGFRVVLRQRILALEAHAARIAKMERAACPAS